MLTLLGNRIEPKPLPGDADDQPAATLQSATGSQRRGDAVNFASESRYSNYVR